jgi:hypothetical protein
MMEQGYCTRPRVRRGIAESNRHRDESTFVLRVEPDLSEKYRQYQETTDREIPVVVLEPNQSKATESPTEKS